MMSHVLTDLTYGINHALEWMRLRKENIGQYYDCRVSCCNEYAYVFSSE
jgi:hypothetical protein